MRSLGPRIERWTQDGVLQVQRQLLEAEGEEGWSDRDKEVPIREHNILPGINRKDTGYSEGTSQTEKESIAKH